MGGMNNLNGAPTFHRPGATCTFIRLPVEMQRAIPEGCVCEFCLANPDKVPRWDTLAVPHKGRHKSNSNYCFTVHMPEMVF